VYHFILKKRKGKEADLYSAFIEVPYTQGALVFFSKFVPKMHRFWDIRLQICRDLENRFCNVTVR